VQERPRDFDAPTVTAIQIACTVTCPIPDFEAIHRTIYGYCGRLARHTLKSGKVLQISPHTQIQIKSCFLKNDPHLSER